jgi:hypothetical protein
MLKKNSAIKLKKYMPSLQVTCINKPHHSSPHEHITHIGGGTGSSRWRLKREDAIQQIDNKTNTFYVVDPKNPRNVAYVGVVRPAHGHAYLRTHADGKWNDNLLAQVECPI